MAATNNVETQLEIDLARYARREVKERGRSGERGGETESHATMVGDRVAICEGRDDLSHLVEKWEVQDDVVRCEMGDGVGNMIMSQEDRYSVSILLRGGRRINMNPGKFKGERAQGPRPGFFLPRTGDVRGDISGRRVSNGHYETSPAGS